MTLPTFWNCIYFGGVPTMHYIFVWVGSSYSPIRGPTLRKVLPEQIFHMIPKLGPLVALLSSYGNAETQ